MNIDLRDYFAAMATEKDIEDMLDYIPEQDNIEYSGHGGKRHITKGLPQHWRHTARYLHADMMLQARTK